MNEDDRRLRIAFVVHDYNRHMGHSRYVVELATRFRWDHEVHVFSNTFEEQDTAEITYHHIPAWRPNSLAGILSFVLPATSLVRGKFDIVHSQGLCGLRHNVATAHVCQPGWYGALVSANGSLTWRETISRALVTPLEQLALAKRSTRRVIAVSERIRRDLAFFFGRSDGVRVIYHGVDSELFHPRNRAVHRDRLRSELGLAPGECLALFVGGLHKGAGPAIRATARVGGVRLVFVSSSNPDAHRALARDLDVADRVVFHPLSKQVEQFYGAADLFLFPTPYDAYGMVISEAMASGLPVVTSRAAGAAELIEHGENGWLTADAWDIDQIAQGLGALAVDQGLRERLGAAARSTIEAYTWDRTAEETLAVYREVVGECEPNFGRAMNGSGVREVGSGAY
jgi:UDP-glucose:(heptosyl)LPS alpha-1,3-glucosyltransferase